MENTLIKTPLPTNIYIQISCLASLFETLQEYTVSEIRVRITTATILSLDRVVLSEGGCVRKKLDLNKKKEETRPAGGVSSAFQALLLPRTVLAPGNTGASFEPKTHFVSVA